MTFSTAFSTAGRFVSGLWQTATQTSTRKCPQVNIKIEDFDKNSVRHQDYVIKKVDDFTHNYTTLEWDFRTIIWPLVTLWYISKGLNIFSSWLSWGGLALGLVCDQLAFQPVQLTLDGWQRLGKHTAALNELKEICAWIVKDQDVTITENSALKRVVGELRKFVLISNIPFSDLAKVDGIENMDKEYLQLLKSPDRNFSEVYAICRSLVLGETAQPYILWLKQLTGNAGGAAKVAQAAAPAHASPRP